MTALPDAILAVDPGDDTGLALLWELLAPRPRLWTATLQFRALPVEAGRVQRAVAKRQWPCVPHGAFSCVAYAAELMEPARPRRGATEHELRGLSQSVIKATRIEGQVYQALSRCLSPEIGPPHLYPCREWRKLIGAERMKGPLAKVAAKAYVADHLGADVPEHEAEAACIALWHLDVLRKAAKDEELGLPEVPRRTRRTPLPEAVTGKMAPEQA